jgi:hypothetical protein
LAEAEGHVQTYSNLPTSSVSQPQLRISFKPIPVKATSYVGCLPDTTENDTSNCGKNPPFAFPSKSVSQLIKFFRATSRVRAPTFQGPSLYPSSGRLTSGSKTP